MAKAKKSKNTESSLFDSLDQGESIKTASELYNYLYEACNILRGPVVLEAKREDASRSD